MFFSVMAAVDAITSVWPSPGVGDLLGADPAARAGAVLDARLAPERAQLGCRATRQVSAPLRGRTTGAAAIATRGAAGSGTGDRRS